MSAGQRISGEVMPLSSFEFDEQAFRGAIENWVQDGFVNQYLPEMQARFDAVFESHQGRPVDEVAARLVEVVGEGEGDPAAFKPYAEAISAGQRITLEPGEPIF
jgi:hypothetical protein